MIDPRREMRWRKTRAGWRGTAGGGSTDCERRPYRLADVITDMWFPFHLRP
jgi:hypothetical protein